LSALGAAIPLLTTITTSLPSILPYGPEQIQMEYKTGTVQVQDELIPEDEDEDVVYETRGKSNLTVTIRIDGGDDDMVLAPRRSMKVSTKRDLSRPVGKSKPQPKERPGKTVKAKDAAPEAIVFQEPEQEDMDDS
jgi:ribonuclease P/MRP protein subunit RPP20